ncbi:MAG: hypothetical protein QW815_03465 [Nitrososphaerota archaeon]
MIYLLNDGAGLDPLFKIYQAEQNNLLPASIIKKIKSRMKYALEGITRVERASGVSYPPYYVEPALDVASTSLEIGQIGLIFARTLPLEVLGSLEIWVQLSAPLIAFGEKPTIHAVIGHEFLHYVELVRRFMTLQTLSSTVPSTLFESSYADTTDLYPAEKLLKDKRLIRLIKSRFPNGFVDEELQEKAVKRWLEKGLPINRWSPDTHVVRVSASAVLNARFDPVLRSKLDEVEKRSTR